MNFKTHAAVVGSMTVAWTLTAIYLTPVAIPAAEMLATTAIIAVESAAAWGIFLGTKELIKAAFNRAAAKAATIDGSSLSSGVTYAKDTVSSAYDTTSRFFGNLWNRQQQPVVSQSTTQPTAQPTTSPKAKNK